MIKDVPFDSILPLRVDKLCLEKQGQRLLDEISFKLDNGLITLILGANGAGKTLLLKICHGLIQPSSGTVLWHDNDSHRVRKKQAMVFQRPVLLKRSVAANIDYVLKLQGMVKRKREERVDQALVLAGLQNLKDRYARVLSGGEQQRLALARAWAMHPEVLFLDEPTAHTDPSATSAIELLIKSFAQQGVKIIMTTHDLSQAKRLAEEILFINQGKLMEQAAASQFFDSPENPVATAYINGELLWS